MSYIICDINDRDIATITLNRPDLHNAFDEQLVVEFTEILKTIDKNTDIRAVIITGAGKSFSAGTDLEWKQRCFNHSEEENYNIALKFAELLKVLDNLSKPTIAKINGNVYGSGIGILCCCDIAISTVNAKFALTEVKLGITPALIGSYVVRGIGERNARRLILTATQFSAHKAKDINLIHEIVNDEEALDDAVEVELSHILSAGQQAITESKKLIQYFHENNSVINSESLDYVAKAFAKVHLSDEAQTRVNHFFNK